MAKRKKMPRVKRNRWTKPSRGDLIAAAMEQQREVMREALRPLFLKPLDEELDEEEIPPLCPLVSQEANGWVLTKVVPDTGAHKSVAPSAMCPAYEVEPSRGSLEGREFVTASGDTIPNLGRKLLPTQSNEGVWTFQEWEIADVTRPLLSITEECDKDQLVIFGKGGGAIIHLKKGTVRRFPRKQGSYEMDMWVPSPKARVGLGFYLAGSVSCGSGAHSRPTRSRGEPEPRTLPEAPAAQWPKKRQWERIELNSLVAIRPTKAQEARRSGKDRRRVRFEDEEWRCVECNALEEPVAGEENGEGGEGWGQSRSSTDEMPGQPGGAQNRSGESGNSGEGSQEEERRASDDERNDEAEGQERQVATRWRRVHTLPTKEAQEAHNKCHIPFRPWCRHCVAGRKPNWPHRKTRGPRPAGATPEVHMDYCFFRNKAGEESMPTIVLRERDSKALAAHVVPYRGGDNDWTVAQVLRDFKNWGIKGDVALRHDQEDSLVCFVAEVVRERQKAGLTTGARQFQENSAVGESESNGFIESGIRGVEGIVRTLKHELEERLQWKLDVHHPVFSWLVEHAADLLTKFQTGEDGLTPFERLRRKEYRGEALDFCAKVWHRVPGKLKGGVMEWRWLTGIWLGVRFDANEHVIAMADGRIVRARSVQSYPEETRWDKDLVSEISGLPWAPTGTTRTRSEGLQGVPAQEEPADGVDAAPTACRGMPVLRKHIDSYGPTAGCLKCRMIRDKDFSRPGQGHSEKCKQRIRGMCLRSSDHRAQAEAGQRRRNGPDAEEPPEAEEEEEDLLEAEGQEEETEDAKEFARLCKQEAERNAQGEAPCSPGSGSRNSASSRRAVVEDGDIPVPPAAEGGGTEEEDEPSAKRQRLQGLTKKTQKKKTASDTKEKKEEEIEGGIGRKSEEKIREESEEQKRSEEKIREESEEQKRGRERKEEKG